MKFLSITTFQTQIAKIIASDDDKSCTDATKIDYKIIKIINTDEEKEIKEDIFRIDTKSESEENDCIYYGDVVSNKNLQEYYGNFRITVTVSFLKIDYYVLTII